MRARRLIAALGVAFGLAAPVHADIVCSANSLFTCGGVGTSTTNNFIGANSFLDAANFKIKNTADPTKIVQFDLSNMTTGNTAVGIYFAGTAATPELWVGQSTAANKIKFKHDGANAVFSTGTGVFAFDTGVGNDALLSQTVLSFAGVHSLSYNTSTGFIQLYDGFAGTNVAHTVVLGPDDNASASAAPGTLRGVRATGSDAVGGALILAPGPGTGLAAGTALVINRNLMTTTGSTTQSSANAIVPCESKTLSNTTGTATAIANVAVASNSAAAARVTVSVQCTNGTEFASSVTTSYQGFANKAGTIAFGTPQNGTEANGASTAGTLNCTVVPTWVANGNSVDFKVTPVITGAATTTTAYVNVENLGPGAVTCK